MARELGAFIFVDGVGDVSVRALDEDLAAATDGGLRRVARRSASCALGNDRSGSRGSSSSAARTFAELGDEL